jgi:hypothetical protein
VASNTEDTVSHPDQRPACSGACGATYVYVISRVDQE